MADPATVLVRPEDGRYVDFGNFGVRFMIWSEESGGGFSLVEHWIPPRTFCAPLHRHSREDEYAYVLEGRLAALLGNDVVYGNPGDLVFQPRYQWHTFWNPGDEPCRILEIISPAGLERFFADMGDASEAGQYVDPTGIAEHYGLEFDLDSMPRLCEEHGLAHRGPSRARR
jgi:mannose-6-phosphate isomerase-like protein (cupin superfamily)